MQVQLIWYVTITDETTLIEVWRGLDQTLLGSVPESAQLMCHGEGDALLDAVEVAFRLDIEREVALVRGLPRSL